VHGVDDLGVIDSLEVDRGDPEVGVSQLPLDDHERDAFMSHLDRVRVPKLVWREPASYSCCGGGTGELSASGRRFPVPADGGPVDDAEERADRETGAELLPGLELLPCPDVHPSFATRVALAVPDKNGPAASVHVGLGKRECFADPQPRSPQHDDERA
jgi:hypothetical protein